ncbi:APC family permease [Microbacterium jejuense]|uniref:APC family permease n=1 Tax=Microbacterium jejuense TaxID=1263637 RepID=A0ABS7HKN3_9MICO|nr:APC family permease [Microbacterium jejuense]MBW9092423.1 APC family permease [Microbacterium jejuense]
MSTALADAIERARPRSDLGARSPFAGLRRRHARTVDVVAQSVAATAPAGVLLVHPAAAYARSGSFAFLDIAITITLVVGVALVIGMFARRIASTGSLYTFAARGLGPHAGLLAGAALGIGYLAVAVNTLSSGSARIASLLSGQEAPPWLVMTLVVGFGAVIAVVVARGLRMSTRILFVLEAIAVVTVLGLSIAALSLTRWDVALLVPRATDFSLDAIITGVAFALIGFVGFESGAALGPETRRPFAAVPRAIMVSVGATGVVMLVGTAAQLSIVADRPGAASLSAVTGLSRLTDLIVALSFLACALAMTNAATRIAFAMSREGLLPAAFGRVSRRGVPAAAGAMLAAAVTAVPVAVLAWGGSRQDMRVVTSPASILGFVLAYALVCAAAPAFLRRIGELTVRGAVLCIVPLAGLLCILCFYLAATVRDNLPGLLWATGILAAVVAAGCARIARHPGVGARIGVHDWPTDADCLDGPARS